MQMPISKSLFKKFAPETHSAKPPRPTWFIIVLNLPQSTSLGGLGNRNAPLDLCSFFKTDEQFRVPMSEIGSWAMSCISSLYKHWFATLSSGASGDSRTRIRVASIVIVWRVDWMGNWCDFVFQPRYGTPKTRAYFPASNFKIEVSGWKVFFKSLEYISNRNSMTPLPFCPTC